MAKESLASMTVARPAVDARLAPPAGLTEAQTAVWATLVNARPANWFTDDHIGMLSQYCRHKVTSDVIAQQIEQFDPAWMADDDGLKRYDKLLGMQERETRAMNALLRSMRITQQSLVRADKVVKLDAPSKKPWDRK